MLSVQMLDDQTPAITYVDVDTFEYGVFQYINTSYLEGENFNNLTFTLTTYSTRVMMHISNGNLAVYSVFTKTNVTLGNVLNNTYIGNTSETSNLRYEKKGGNDFISQGGATSVQVHNFLPSHGKHGMFQMTTEYTYDSTIMDSGNETGRVVSISQFLKPTNQTNINYIDDYVFPEDDDSILGLQDWKTYLILLLLVIISKF